jgi:hypothetical protein
MIGGAGRGQAAFREGEYFAQMLRFGAQIGVHSNRPFGRQPTT